MSPATEEVVNESLRNGLPIIPFAYPTFFMASRNQEEVKNGIRKGSLKRMKNTFSSVQLQQNTEVFEKTTAENKSLESIVRRAKHEMESYKQVCFSFPVKEQQLI